MTSTLCYATQVAISVVFGVASAGSFASHFLVHALDAWQDWVIGLLIFLSAFGFGLVNLIMKWLKWSVTIIHVVHARLILLILSLVVSGLFVAVEWFQPRPVQWWGGVGTQPQPPLAYLARKAWNERHWGIEIHAAVNDDPQWTWLAYADVPWSSKLFGGTMRALVTQPEWAVFDQQGHVYQGGDGLELRFVVQQNGKQKIMQHLDLNLHARQEQRRWHVVEVSLPADSERLSIEALPGPPGSNNWYDRVWLSVESIDSIAGNLIRLADWLSLSLLVCISTAAILSLLRIVYTAWLERAISMIAINLVAIVICFSIGEAYLRMKKIEPYVRTFPGQYHNKPDGPSWAQVDSYFGWVVSNKNNPEINPQGFRDTKDFTNVDHYSGKIRVMILGDSFMLGAGVSADENVPSFLQTMLEDKYEVFNLAVGGWGIDQMYLAYQKYKDVIRPHVVILAFIGDDVDRVLEAYRVFEGMNKPSFAITDGKLILRTSTSRNDRFLNALMSETVFFGLIMRQVSLIRDARPIVEHIFLQIAQETQHKNQKFVVVRIPTKEDANPISRLIRSLYSFKGTFSGIDMQYLEPLDAMTEAPNWTTNFYLSNDGHLSTAGNRYLADYIYKQILWN